MHGDHGGDRDMAIVHTDREFPNISPSSRSATSTIDSYFCDWAANFASSRWVQAIIAGEGPGLLPRGIYNQLKSPSTPDMGVELDTVTDREVLIGKLDDFEGDSS